MTTPDDRDYAAAAAREAQHWVDHLGRDPNDWYSWIDHPVVRRHYNERARIDGQSWDRWAVEWLGAPASRSLELGCGAAERSFLFLDAGVTRAIEGIDLNDRIHLAESRRASLGVPGSFRIADANQLTLAPNTYDLIFACHSFHHFEALERVMDEVARALTPRGLFVLEEFVGPTQFQWTDEQIDLVRALTTLIPSPFRRLRWGATKTHEGRPTRQEVEAVSPFESIRSAEIVPLFRERFDVVAERRLGGTIQHLLYNGIIHNFAPDDPEAMRLLEAIWKVEDALVDAALVPSDFSLLVGTRRG